MFGYVLLVILVTAGVTLAESFLIAFVAGLLGIGVSFKYFLCDVCYQFLYKGRQ